MARRRKKCTSADMLVVALPGRQAAGHRRGGGREMVSISRVEGRTGDAARMPGVATSREVVYGSYARESRSRAPCSAVSHPHLRH